MLVEINKNHIKAFIQPSESLSSVTANADLLQIAAVMAKVPAISARRIMLEKLAVETSQVCFP